MAATIDVKSSWHTDRLLHVRFYKCPKCRYTHVPYGNTDSSGRDYSFDANYCPSCGVYVEWENRPEEA